MKFGIIISSNDLETVWNAFRYAEFAHKAGDEVKVFLTGPVWDLLTKVTWY